MPGDGQRLGHGGVVDRDLAGHLHRDGLRHEHVLGVSTGGLRGETGHLQAVLGAHQRQRDDPSADRPATVRIGAVGHHLADELVAHHDVVVGRHEVVVADLRDRVVRDLRVVPGVQVGPADAGAQHLEEHLAGPGLEVRHVLDGELGLVADDGAHG